MRLVTVVAAVGLGLACSCAHVRGDEAFTNVLPNPSFEEGATRPSEWQPVFSVGGEWRWGGVDGERCLRVSGHAYAGGGWITRQEARVGSNALYRVEYSARAHNRGSGDAVVLGLEDSDWQVPVGPDWERSTYFLRSPAVTEGERFHVRHPAGEGAVDVDQITMMPALALHRSTGRGGGLFIGRGETIKDRHYVAVHDPGADDTNDCRFLARYSGAFHDDRWILRPGDSVVYCHEVRRLGVGLLPPEAMMHNLWMVPGIPVDESAVTDPRVRSHFAHGRMAVKVWVEKCSGALLVQIGRRDGSWQSVGVVDKPGEFSFEAAAEMTHAFSPWVRLVMIEGKAEVTRYEYSSVLGGGRSVSAEGMTTYLTILHADPRLVVAIADTGSLGLGHDNEVKLAVRSRGDRMTVDVQCLVEAGEEKLSSTNKVVCVASGSERSASLSYLVDPARSCTLVILGREVATGELLFLLHGQLHARQGRGASAVDRLQQ